MEEATVPPAETELTLPPSTQEEIPLPTRNKPKEETITTTASTLVLAPTTETPIAPATVVIRQEVTEEQKQDVLMIEATTPITKIEVKEKGTPMDLIPIEETPKEKEEIAAKRAKLMPVLQKFVVAKVSLFSDKEKEKLIELLQIEVNQAKELEKLVAI